MTRSARRSTHWAVNDVLQFERATRTFRGGAGVSELTFCVE